MEDPWRLEHHLKELSYTMAMHALTLAEIAGMKAANDQRIADGQTIAYNEQAFIDTAVNNGMTHNAVVSRHEI